MFSFIFVCILNNGLFYTYLIDKCDGNERSKSVCATATSTLGLLPDEEADRPPALFLLKYEVYYNNMALTSKTTVCVC